LALFSSVVGSLLLVSGHATAAPCVIEDPEPEPETLRLGIGTAFGVLNLPKLGVGLEALAELQPASFPFPIDLTFVYWLDNTAELTPSQLDLGVHPLIVVPFPDSGSRIVFSALKFGAAICPYQHELKSGRILLCGGLYGGLLRGSPEGFVGGEEKTSALYGVEAYARWHFHLTGALGLSYSVGLFGALGRERFGHVDAFGDFREDFQVSPVGGRLDLALTFGL
jgi:hypothetical protein